MPSQDKWDKYLIGPTNPGPTNTTGDKWDKYLIPGSQISSPTPEYKAPAWTQGSDFDRNMEEASHRVANAFSMPGLPWQERANEVIKGTGQALAPAAVPMFLGSPLGFIKAGVGGLIGSGVGDLGASYFANPKDPNYEQSVELGRNLGAITGAGLSTRVPDETAEGAYNFVTHPFRTSAQFLRNIMKEPKEVSMVNKSPMLPTISQLRPATEVGPRTLPMPSPRPTPADIEVGPKMLPMPKPKPPQPDIEVGPNRLPLPTPTPKSPDVEVGPKTLPMPTPKKPEWSAENTGLIMKPNKLPMPAPKPIAEETTMQVD